MGQMKRRRRYPTVVNRGLGLLEVILPRGGSDDPTSTVPPGQRDESGFWFPVGYTRPGDIFTAQQRRLQEKQRAIQKERRVRPPDPSQEGQDLHEGAVPQGVRGREAVAPAAPGAAYAGDAPIPLPPACVDGEAPPPDPVLPGRRGRRPDPPIFAATGAAPPPPEPLPPGGRRVDSAKSSE